MDTHSCCCVGHMLYVVCVVATCPEEGELWGKPPKSSVCTAERLQDVLQQSFSSFHPLHRRYSLQQ